MSAEIFDENVLGQGNYPKVSIIVPIYNVEKHLKKCLDSIINQTFKNIEIVLVNDCSSDNSQNICEEYVEKDTRIKLIYNQQNLGASLSREVGLKASSGNFIQFIDSDDWIETDMINEMVEKAESENLDMVICDIYDYSSGRILTDVFFEQGKFFFLKNITTTFWICCVWNKLIRRDVYKNVIFPRTSYAEDRYITLQTVYYSEKIGRVSKPFYHYVYNTDSTTRGTDNKTRNLCDLYDNYVLIIEFLKNNYKTEMKLFEPELSKHLNGIKIDLIKNKEVRKNKKIFKLYPESRFEICLIKKSSKRIYHLLVPELFQIIIKTVRKLL